MKNVSSTGLRSRSTIAAAAAALALAGTAMVTASSPTGSSGFLLGGTAQLALDPENPANDVIKIDTSTGGFGTVSRRVNSRLDRLDNMLEFKSYFVAPKTCIAGSPRVQLAIDLNGDGVADGNAFGYTAPPFAGCASDRWQYDDLTDELPRWDLSQFVLAGFPTAANICANPLFSSNPAVCPFQAHSGYIPWAVFEAVLSTLFPLHKVCTVALVDDTFGAVGMSGIAYYDLISAGRATWVDRADTAGRGFAKGCGAVANHDDDDHDGDCDHDHDVDNDDHDYDHNRRERAGSR